MGMPQGQIDLPLERPRCRWKCIIKVELEVIGWKSVNSISVSEYGQVVGCCLHVDEPFVYTQRTGNFLTNVWN
jgi:hypothetical protein